MAKIYNLNPYRIYFGIRPNAVSAYARSIQVDPSASAQTNWSMPKLEMWRIILQLSCS